MERKVVGTPYDDVFRTLLNDCTSLMLPVVNEIFGETYTGEEKVEFLPNEHFIYFRDLDTKEKITDSCFVIRGITDKKYHIECQSTADHSMLLRMFEYDADERKLQELKAEYRGIVERLALLCEEGKISEYVKCTLIDMSKKVAENVGAHYENVTKGVTSVMGGKVLEYEAKTILQAGIREGRMEGERDGKIKAYVEMIHDGLVSVAEAAKRLDISEKKLEEYL